MRAPLKTAMVGWAPSLNIIQANPSNPTLSLRIQLSLLPPYTRDVLQEKGS